MDYAFGMNVLKSLSHLPHLSTVSVQNSWRGKISPDLLSLMSMDFLYSATGQGCRCSYKARRGRNEMPSHLHRSLRMVARIHAGGIATSMLPGRNPV